MALRDHFGSVIATDQSGMYVFIGAPYGDSLWASSTGTVFVYKLENTTALCREVAQISPPVATVESENVMFGAAIALHGTRALIGAPGFDGGQGAVFALHLKDDFWILDTVPIPRNSTSQFSRFGASLWIYGDDAIVGEPGQGFVHLYRYKYVESSGTSPWRYETRFSPPNPAHTTNFGKRVAITENYFIASSGGDAAAVHIFHKLASPSLWYLEYVIMYPEESIAFGYSLSIDHEQIVIGAPDAPFGGAAYIYERSGRSWIKKSDITNIGPHHGKIGESVSIIGNRVIVGAPGSDNAGSAYIFERFPPKSWELGYKLSYENLVLIDDDTHDTEYGLTVAQSPHLLFVGTGNRITTQLIHGAYAYKLTSRAVLPALSTTHSPSTQAALASACASGLPCLSSFIFGFLIPLLAIMR